MEQASRSVAERHNPDGPKRSKREYLKEFGDLLLHHHQEKDMDNTFDNDEMCE